jgi:hypothetical protein
MIFGRPTNLWLGLVTAGVALVQGLVVIFVPEADPQQVATAGALIVAFLGAVIALVAGQPPTLNPGDAYKVVTTGDQPNVQKVANTNVTPIAPNTGVTEPPTT